MGAIEAAEAEDGSSTDDRAERWRRRLAESRWPMVAIFVASAAETLVVPIPIEVVLLPFMMARRRQVWWIAAVVTLGCILASVVGYGIGYYSLQGVGQWLVDTLSAGQDMEQFRQMFADHGFLAIVAIGVIPIPFQIAMLVAGSARYPIILFVLAATLARGVRYFGLALLVVLAGDRALELWKRHKKTTVLAAIVVVAALVVAVQWIGGG